MKLTICLLSALALVACVTPAQRAERQAQILEGYKATCSGYGFQPGSPDHAACVERTAQADRARSAGAAAAISQAFQRPPLPAPPAMNCTSQRSGDTVSTTCN